MNEENGILNLLEQIKNGDESAFAEFYSQTYKYVYSRAKCMFSDEEEVQDLVQEVYLALYRNATTIQSSESIFGWLKTTTFYQGTKMLKKRRKEVLLSEDGEEMFEAIPDDEPEIEEGYMNQEDVEVIRECINRLSDEQKTVLLAYYYDNLKVNEIADILSLSAGTVKSRLYLARKNLQVHIEEEEKKRGYKLHSFGAVTLALALRMFLQGNMEVAGSAEETIFARVCQDLNIGIGKAASTQGGIAEQATQEGTRQVTQEGVKQAGKGPLGKLGALGAKKIAVSAVGIIAAATIGGVVIGSLNKEEKQPQEPVQMEEEKDHKITYTELQVWHEDYTKILLELLYLPNNMENYEIQDDISTFISQGVEGKLRFGLKDANDDNIPELVVALQDLSEKFVFTTGDSIEVCYQGKAENNLEVEFYELTLENVEEQFGIKISQKSLSLYQNLGRAYAEYMETYKNASDTSQCYFVCGGLYLSQDDEEDYVIVDNFVGYQMLVADEEQYHCLEPLCIENNEYWYAFIEKEGILVKSCNMEKGELSEVFEINENYKLEKKLEVLINKYDSQGEYMQDWTYFYTDEQGTHEISEAEFEAEYLKYCAALPIEDGRSLYFLNEFLPLIEVVIELVD